MGDRGPSTENQLDIDVDLLTEVLNSHKDLGQFAQETGEALKQAEVDNIQQYMEHAESLADLHFQICSCDNILLKMENMLERFQWDLSNISNEIQSLQNQSVDMSVKLKNRQVVRNELSQLINEVVVPEVMIKTIMDEPVTESAFLEQLHEFQHKVVYARNQAFKEALACQEVESVLVNLKLKAIEKTREYMLKKIYELRKPLANYQLTQSSLVKHRFYFEFILFNDRHIAKEIRDEYVNTMSKVLYAYFKTYINRLMKLRHEELASKDDLLGSLDPTKSSNIFYARPKMVNKAPVFALSNRDAVIGPELEAAIIVPHAADQSKAKFQLEALLRSVLYAVLDHASREYFFLCDFFLVSGQHSVDMFEQVFGKTVTVVMNSFENYITGSYDCIALLICIQIVRKYRHLCQKRDLFVLEKLWDTVLMQLWPRVDHLMELNLNSFRNVDLKQLAPLNTKPLFIIRRYGEFFGAITVINASLPDDKFQRYLYTMEGELAGLLSRIKTQLSNTKERLVFLINNYDLVVSVLAERLTVEQLEAQDSHKCLQAYVSEYADALLSTYFGPLISFVRQWENVTDEHCDREMLKNSVAELSQLVVTFNSDWKKNIEKINVEVMTNFSNFRNGSNVLQNCLTQLVAYYHRLHKVLSKPALSNLPARNELVNIHNLMVEVRKFKPSF